jgi:hypothetical protein
MGGSPSGSLDGPMAVRFDSNLRKVQHIHRFRLSLTDEAIRRA